MPASSLVADQGQFAEGQEENGEQRAAPEGQGAPQVRDTGQDREDDGVYMCVYSNEG
jgi:hypothetical protein